VNISIVIPAKNEEENIKPLVDEIKAALGDHYSYEIIYVDDGSTDNTYKNVLRLSATDVNQIRVIKHKYSVGQSTAIRTGVANAKGELIVTLDADGQNAPEDIPTLLTQAFLFPIGSDFCIAGHRKSRKDTHWKRIQSKIANAVRRFILGDNTPDTGCGLKVFPKSTFISLPYFDHMHRFLPALISRQGGIVKVIEVKHRDRQYGKSKYNMLGRLGVGIVDMIGVLWLQRRCRLNAVIIESESNS